MAMHQQLIICFEEDWALAGLRAAVGFENFELIIKFSEYRDFVDIAIEVVEDYRLNNAVEVSAELEIAIITIDEA
ncbi:hypothetical protein RUND412_006542 [Rhizina undulata]